MHLCERQTNFTRQACCQLILLLNDTTRVPLCDIEYLTQNETDSTFYAPPILLDEPSDVHEDHMTFILGIIVLMLVAIGCIFTLSRLVKPRFSLVNSGNPSSYDFMMWMPSKSHQSSLMLVYLKSITCRQPNCNQRHSNISIVSSNIGLLPSYESATSMSTSTSLSFPPPPYVESQRLSDQIV